MNSTLTFSIQARDVDKWDKALVGSYAIVFARLIENRRLVGFARATSDRALNGTIWDVVTDPMLPDEVRYIPRSILYCFSILCVCLALYA